jgi:hypothetical protein
VNAAKLRYGIVVQNIANVDLQMGTFEGDFAVIIRNENGTPFTGLPELMNGARYIRIDNRTDANPAHVRILSGFYFEVSSNGFPFDPHRLAISFYVPGADLVHDPSLSGIARTIKLPGWEIDRTSVTATVEAMDFSGAGTRSIHTVYFKVSRPFLKMFVICFLPPIFILLVLLLSFSVPSKEAVTRLGTSSGALISMVMFHANIAIPPTQYLTLVDKFFVISYFVLVMATIVNVVICALNHKHGADSPIVKRINRVFEIGVWVCTPPTYGLLFVPWQFFILLLVLPPLVVFGSSYLVKRMRTELVRVRVRRERSMQQGLELVEMHEENNKINESRSVMDFYPRHSMDTSRCGGVISPGFSMIEGEEGDVEAGYPMDEVPCMPPTPSASMPYKYVAEPDADDRASTGSMRSTRSLRSVAADPQKAPVAELNSEALQAHNKQRTPSQVPAPYPPTLILEYHPQLGYVARAPNKAHGVHAHVHGVMSPAATSASSVSTVAGARKASGSQPPRPVRTPSAAKMGLPSLLVPARTSSAAATSSSTAAGAAAVTTPTVPTPTSTAGLTQAPSTNTLFDFKLATNADEDEDGQGVEFNDRSSLLGDYSKDKSA